MKCVKLYYFKVPSYGSNPDWYQDKVNTVNGMISTIEILRAKLQYLKQHCPECKSRYLSC